MGSVLGRAIGPLIEGDGVTLCVCSCSVSILQFLEIFTKAVIISKAITVSKIISIVCTARRKAAEGNPDESKEEKEETGTGSACELGGKEEEGEKGEETETETAGEGEGEKEAEAAETDPAIPDGDGFKSMIDDLVWKTVSTVANTGSGSVAGGSGTK